MNPFSIEAGEAPVEHFLGAKFCKIQEEDDGSASRSQALRKLVKALEDMLLQQSPGVPGTLPGCKMLGILQASGIRQCATFVMTPFELRADLDHALKALAAGGPNSRGISDALATLCDGLGWYSAQSGPFASLNFERGHAHALLGITTGGTDKGSVLFGVTVMSRYTRFPDHAVKLPRVMFPLSEGEYLNASGMWIEGQIGAPITCVAGRDFAMRTAAKPLLALWCQRHLP
ncbi:hypothetical protein EFQ99_19515 [Rhizobium vallis]|uniref:Uncharacterized protein n=1 Tax=Rhizobium vallis TaxID=634290 RepID=A0A432PJ24_9HYPH|nr:dimethylsulfonioproprionate lyase family protein [Rhizobium vallis]RUM24136.1 hypothetical protein EFQ99_19515 [Rhizobium vallis]